MRMIPQFVALGAREILGNGVIESLAYWPVKGAQPSNKEAKAAVVALQSVGCSATARSNYDRMTPSDIAATHGNAPVLRALLAIGAAPPASYTRLLVLGAHHPAIIRVLLAAGASPNALIDMDDDEPAQSPLMAAALQYQLASMKALLAGGASVDFPDGTGRTALMRCVSGESCDPAIVKTLVKAGADVNARDDSSGTVLHIVASNPQPWSAAVAQQLHDAGADARANDDDGLTPLEYVDNKMSALYQVIQSADA